MKTVNDEMNFIIEKYGEKIFDYLGSKDLAATFYTDSELYADSILNEQKPLVDYGNFNVQFFQDYSFDEKIVTDLNYCKIKDYKFVKIVTPFTRSDSYDFLITRQSEIKDIVHLLKEKEMESRENIIDFPVIGLDFTELKKNTTDFLLNEEFRNYCRKKNIKLKRGVILEGKPGTGKTLSIQWLKHEASKHNIRITNFKNIDSFLKNQDEYYQENKSIFVFEDFDAALRDRKETSDAPNQVLAQVLNTLDGIDKIEDVVSIFTTNKINMFDDAFLRPGRIDKVITYQLPQEHEQREFFKAYIEEEKEYHDEMIHLISNLTNDISYAVLKGICDEINIWKFGGEQINNIVIENIIKDKIKRKGEAHTSDTFIL